MRRAVVAEASLLAEGARKRLPLTQRVAPECAVVRRYRMTRGVLVRPAHRGTGLYADLGGQESEVFYRHINRCRDLRGWRWGWRLRRRRWRGRRRGRRE